MTIRARKKIADNVQWPKNVRKYLKLQRKIKQVILQAVFPKADRAFLSICIDTSLGRVAKVSRIESGCNFGIVKTNDRSLIQIVQNLRVHAVAIHGNRFKVTFIQQWTDDVRHVVLRSFEGKKDRRLVRVSKSSSFCSNGPEQVTYTPGKSTTQRRGSDFPTGAAFRTIKYIEVRLLHTSLGGKHQDGFARHALREQIAHPLDGCGRLARAHRTGDKEFQVQGRFNNLTLRRTKADSERRS